MTIVHKNNYHFIRMLVLTIVLITAVKVRAAQDEKKVTDKTKLFKFSHGLHAGLGIDCIKCHVAIAEKEQSTDSTLPGHDQCGTCHEEHMTSDCGYCHSDAKNPKPFPKPVNTIKINHKVHIIKQKMECTVCHKGLDTADFAGIANLPAKSTCSTCHKS